MNYERKENHAAICRRSKNIFVAEATKCDFDIDVFYNRVTIDAKSILGVLSLDLARVLTVQMNGDNAEFEEYLDTLAPVSTTAA